MKAYEEVLVYTFADGSQLLEEAGKIPTFSPTDELTDVKVDQSLLDIAFDYYGNHEDWVNIFLCNNLTDPWEDLVGTRLIIPTING